MITSLTVFVFMSVQEVIKTMEFLDYEGLKHYDALLKDLLKEQSVELSDATVAYSDFSKAGSRLKLVYNDDNELELQLDRSVQYNVTLTTPAYVWYGSQGPLTFIVKTNDFTEGYRDTIIDLSTGESRTLNLLNPREEASTDIDLTNPTTSDITVSWYIGQTKQKDKTIQCRLPILYSLSEINTDAVFDDSSLQTTAGYKHSGVFTYNDLTPTVDEIYIGIPGSNDMGEVKHFDYMSGASQCDCRTIIRPEATIYINGQQQIYTIFKCNVTSGFNFHITNIYSNE